MARSSFNNRRVIITNSSLSKRQGRSLAPAVAPATSERTLLGVSAKQMTTNGNGKTTQKVIAITGGSTSFKKLAEDETVRSISTNLLHTAKDDTDVSSMSSSLSSGVVTKQRRSLSRDRLENGDTPTPSRKSYAALSPSFLSNKSTSCEYLHQTRAEVFDI